MKENEELPTKESVSVREEQLAVEPQDVESLRYTNNFTSIGYYVDVVVHLESLCIRG